MKAIACLVTFLAVTITGQAVSAAEISSLYTKLDLKKCRLVDSNANEGGWAEFSCKGSCSTSGIQPTDAKARH